MKIINTYSFKGGEKFLKTKHPKELKEVQDAIKALDATLCLTKESKEKTKKGQVLFSPVDMNNYLKLVCHQKGWTTKAEGGKKRKFVEPRHAFGKGRFREMDGIKNKVDLEHRGESNIDIPVFVMSIGLTDEEKTKSQTLRELFRTNKKEALLKIKLRKYSG